ncbi:MAG: ribosome recycling factor [Desulfuromonadaceae bacterium GWB2_53_15]|nr:MAG: ribosome recycling factor [Desulfuromonadales bacterium GWD2_54_10]OHB26633.1 MAG: ribosome recycling factor [Desulfuromonadaceae bacterium GWB2_53_15]
MQKSVLDDMKSHMEKTLGVLKNEFQKIRTGRASTGILDSVKVDYYGNLSSISQVATLAVPEPRTITIAPWEAKIIPAIEKAILNANIGLTPSNDGKTIRLNLPPLTEERRKEIVKDLKKKAEEDKVALRNIRRDAIDRLKKLEKDKAITEDELKKSEKEVQDITKSFEAKMDEAVAHKEKEVMEV